MFHVEQRTDLVMLTGLRVWSLCEHHLLPFFCDLTIAYRPLEQQVIGLSKLARIALEHSHRLQVQERLVSGIADQLRDITGATSVAVLASGQHLCMGMRGVERPGTMRTLHTTGLFTPGEALHQTFIDLADIPQPHHR